MLLTVVLSNCSVSAVLFQNKAVFETCNTPFFKVFLLENGSIFEFSLKKRLKLVFGRIFQEFVVYNRYILTLVLGITTAKSVLL